MHALSLNNCQTILSINWQLCLYLQFEMVEPVSFVVSQLHIRALRQHCIFVSCRQLMATFSPCLGSRASVAACSTFQFLAVGDAASSGNGRSLEVWTDLSGTWQEHQFREHSTPFGNVLIAQVPVTGEGA